jgi:hypothetical protein
MLYKEIHSVYSENSTDDTNIPSSTKFKLNYI